MMKKLILFSLALCLFTSLAAQRFSYLTNGPIKESLPFITAETFSFYIVPVQQNAFPEQVRLRWVDGDGNTSEWHEFYQDGHADADRYVSQLGFASKKHWTDFELEMPASGPVTLFIYDPGPTLPKETKREPTFLEGALCFRPQVEEREDWCPSGNCPVDATPAATTVTHLIVHHSAGVNTASDWSAIVRSIWDFHVNGNGWDDIGYNYLVDPNGVIYVGRGNDVRGAHFCGQNSNTMGTCVLGDFTSTTPTLAAHESLQELLAWKCQRSNIDPEAVTYHAGSNANLIGMAGHRDGCNTSCPGNAFYAIFGNCRQSVVDQLAACSTSSTNDPEAIWAKEIVVSPNPGRGAISITGVPLNSRIEVYAINGQLLLSESADKVTNVEAMLEKAKPGAYLLRIEHQGAAIARKLIRK